MCRFSHQRVDRLIVGPSGSSSTTCNSKAGSDERRHGCANLGSAHRRSRRHSQAALAPRREGHTRHQDRIDLTRERLEGSAGIRLPDAPHAGTRLRLGIVNSMQRQVAARQGRCAAAPARNPRDWSARTNSLGIEFAAERQIGEHASCALKLREAQQTGGDRWLSRERSARSSAARWLRMSLRSACLCWRSADP